jgi:hypothetical protein
MNKRTVRIRLLDPEDHFFEDKRLEVVAGPEHSDLDLRRQISEQIEAEGRYYLFEEDSIFPSDARDIDYRATVLVLRGYTDRCPNCGDQSEETRAVAVLAADEAKWGQCPRCDRIFRMVRM